jgi:hypoxanthine-guanine phosphoribosyltransferase
MKTQIERQYQYKNRKLVNKNRGKYMNLVQYRQVKIPLFTRLKSRYFRNYHYKISDFDNLTTEFTTHVNTKFNQQRTVIVPIIEGGNLLLNRANTLQTAKSIDKIPKFPLKFSSALGNGGEKHPLNINKILPSCYSSSIFFTEDIIDTGRTIYELLIELDKHARNVNIRSVDVYSLVIKKQSFLYLNSLSLSFPCTVTFAEVLNTNKYIYFR